MASRPKVRRRPNTFPISTHLRTDYIQTLQDENKIRVEKIGSGNWYWSFPSEDKKAREKALKDAEAAHEKASSVVQDIKQKLTDARAERESEADMLDVGAESRDDLTATKSELEKEVNELEKQVAVYSESVKPMGKRVLG